MLLWPSNYPHSQTCSSELGSLDFFWTQTTLSISLILQAFRDPALKVSTCAAGRPASAPYFLSQESIKWQATLQQLVISRKQTFGSLKTSRAMYFISPKAITTGDSTMQQNAECIIRQSSQQHLAHL